MRPPLVILALAITRCMPEPGAGPRIASADAPTGLAEQRELSWLPERSLFSGAGALRAVSSRLSAHSCAAKFGRGLSGPSLTDH